MSGRVKLVNLDLEPRAQNSEYVSSCIDRRVLGEALRKKAQHWGARPDLSHSVLIKDDLEHVP